MSHTTQSLLIELLSEELPPKSLHKLGNAFSHLLQEQLSAQQLLTKSSIATTFATPRRLGIHITCVKAQAPEQVITQKIMPVSVAMPNGNASDVLLKKLSSLGLDESVIPSLKREFDGKTDVLVYTSTRAGASITHGAQAALDHAIAKLPIPKMMTYQLADGIADVKFVRPVHRLLALYGGEVLPLSVLGLTANNQTEGHRFEALTNPITIIHADHYQTMLLEKGKVIVSFEKRRQAIINALSTAKQRAGDDLSLIQDEALLNEVCALVEYPNVLTCQFEKEFLNVPQECLILTMKANQKYFPLLNANGALTNQFLMVSNVSPQDVHFIIEGNEKVVRPRLADAKFFYDQDRKRTLASRIEQLRHVVYHNKLGNQWERTLRVQALAKLLSERIQIKHPQYISTHWSAQDAVSQVSRAAYLAKTDLLTDMVGEFPELQGIMGSYYAQHDGEGIDIAMAIEDHYKPRFAGDSLARNAIGKIVALADKLETLFGMFAIGNLPSGDKDPFALRRHALGVLRMLMESSSTCATVPLTLTDILQVAPQAFPQYADDALVIQEKLNTFFLDRLATVLKDQGFATPEISAVLSVQADDLPDVLARLSALKAFAQLPEAPALIAANKRVHNILKKSLGADAHVNIQLFQEKAENTLYDALLNVSNLVDERYECKDYVESLCLLALLRDSVDAFFAEVMVNCDQDDVRFNRLGLLSQLNQAMNKVAMIAELA